MTGRCESSAAHPLRRGTARPDLHDAVVWLRPEAGLLDDSPRGVPAEFGGNVPGPVQVGRQGPDPAPGAKRARAVPTCVRRHSIRSDNKPRLDPPAGDARDCLTRPRPTPRALRDDGSFAVQGRGPWVAGRSYKMPFRSSLPTSNGTRRRCRPGLRTWYWPWTTVLPSIEPAWRGRGELGRCTRTRGCLPRWRRGKTPRIRRATIRS
jgi:hypothetical protein